MFILTVHYLIYIFNQIQVCNFLSGIFEANYGARKVKNKEQVYKKTTIFQSVY